MTMSGPTKATARNAAMFFLAMLVVVVTWAVGIPRFASPDEPAHVFKAYGTAHGELLGSAAPPQFPSNLREFDGPDSLGAPDPFCYNGLPDVPASCVTTYSPLLISSASRYPPWYYGLIGLPVAASGESTSVFTYRLVSAIVCVAALTLAMLLAKRSLRPDVAGLQLAALTPMAVFLMASVNPNAAEIAGFVAIWACMTRVATDAELPMRLLMLASFLSAVVVLMRPVSIVWMAGLVVVVLIGASRQRRRDLFAWRPLAWAIGPTAVALVLSWVWAVYSSFEVKDDRLTNSLSLSAALHLSVDNWGRYFRQTIGVLGWLDTTLPFFVYVAWIVALVVVVIIHLRGASPRGIVALLALAAAWLALPLIINGFTNSRAGLTYQGRYSLPIFVGLVFLPMWSDRPTLRLPRLSQRWLVGVVLAFVVVAEVGAFWQMLRRFSVGADGKIILTGRLPWQPSVDPMVLIAINAIAMLAVSWLALRPWRQVEAAAGEWDGESAQHGSH
ncbi:MAG: hypothetical protein QOJ66_3335 [Ilumatobacteraceae bacterium]